MLNSKFPWYISYFSITVITIPDRINIKKESLCGDLIFRGIQTAVVEEASKASSDDSGGDTAKTV